MCSWLVEHAADLLSKYQVGEDGRTGYERLKGKPCNHELVEFGEKVHYKFNKKIRPKDDKLEINWGEGFFLGKLWRTGEAAIGTRGGIVKAATIRRVGAHRRWDREGLEEIRGVPWRWNPDEEGKEVGLKVRWLTEEERMSGAATREENLPRAYRMRLKKSDFLKHGFTEGCPGCTALIAGTEPRGHLEKCRQRMEEAIVSTEEGRQRKEKHTQHENELLARHMEHRFGEEDEERKTKKVRTEGPERSRPSSSSSSQEPVRKRGQESDDEDYEEEQKRRKVKKEKSERE